MDKYIGTLLGGRYEILEVLGVGGMAMVYKARCRVLNRFVAIKILKEEFAQDEEFRRRFYNESQAVAKLSHNNIVSVYDVAHSDGIDYIVMELIDGISLKEYLQKKGHLSRQETVFFAQQIARALEHVSVFNASAYSAREICSPAFAFSSSSAAVGVLFICPSIML